MKAFISNSFQIPYQSTPIGFLSERNQLNKKIPSVKMSIGNEFSKKTNFLPKTSQKKEIYLKLNTSIEDVIMKLQEIQIKGDFLKFCYINREHLSYDLLYRLTVLKLRSESNKENTTQIQKIEIFRKKILENTMFVDQAVAQSLILGEKRIKEILNKSQNQELVEKNIGEDRVSVSCFWVVLFASLVAWEKKSLIDGQIDSTGTYQKLLNIKKIFKKSDKHQKLLAVELKNIQTYLTDDQSKTSFQKIDLDSISGLKLLISQLEKLPSSSYGPLLKKISNIHDEIFFETYGIETKGLHQQYSPFVPLPIKTKSKLVEIQQNK
mmetsp:Transcript_9082/g.14593  ORF Transcript_9082/g.14593 Transcript_9082/m.14593 type:complete len:322 (-) Transcript_9082:1671-2636(-)